MLCDYLNLPCPNGGPHTTADKGPSSALALIPLAVHGGSLWQPLCFAQIGGLSLATFIELLLVKVFYAIRVECLKIVTWQAKGKVVMNE
jgi:hypothetical protein